ncbi:MAG: CoA-transferase [Candidatus Caldarchaeum sp.]
MTLEDTASLVNDGDSITISGMTFYRNPMSFLFALEKRGVKRLYFIDREPGVGLEYMVQRGMVSKARVAMATLEWFGIPRGFRRAVESGDVEILEDTCGAFMAGIRAGAFGIPFQPVKGVIGSQLVKINEDAGTWKVVKDPFNGGEILLVKAIEPDVAVIHVHRADVWGNAEIDGPLYEDEFKAKAAKKLIITTEEIVDEGYFRGKRPTINGEYVSAVVNAKGGARPTGMYGLYDPDFNEILRLLNMA